MKKLEIGDFFKKKSEQFTIEPPVDGFDRLLKNNELLHYNKVRFWKRVGLWVMVPAVAILVGIILILQPQDKVDDSQNFEKNIQTSSVADTLNVIEKENFIYEFTEETSISKEQNTIVQSVVDEEPIENIEQEVVQNIIAPVSSIQPLVADSLIVVKTDDNSGKFSKKYVPSSDSVVEPASSQPKAANIIPDYMLSDSYIDVVEEEPETDPDEMDNYSQNTQNAPQMYIPNAFKPDGDGINDLFKPEYVGAVYDYDLIIADRKGEVVFRSKDFNIGWDGECNGKPMPQGIYVYVIMYRNADGYRQIQKGMVTIFR